MTFEEALEVLKRGGKVSRKGRTYVLVIAPVATLEMQMARGLHDVSDPENPKRIAFDEEDRSADDWEEDDLEPVETVPNALPDLDFEAKDEPPTGH